MKLSNGVWLIFDAGKMSEQDLSDSKEIIKVPSPPWSDNTDTFYCLQSEYDTEVLDYIQTLVRLRPAMII